MASDKELQTELTRIRKLLVLLLVEKGVSASQIGKALGLTAAKDVRAIVPVKRTLKVAKYES